MNIHWLQHVEFEGLAQIAEWAIMRNHRLRSTRFYRDEPLPALENLDMLIVMGGPMSIHDENDFPWLAEEKHFIRLCIAEKKAVLGICLGAQLLADALGAQVFANKEKEIGWYQLTRKKQIPREIKSLLPQQQTVLHWHGETLALPQGAAALYRSAACENQAFLMGDRIIGLQFHLEIGATELTTLIENCRHELHPGPWIQSEAVMVEESLRDHGCRKLLFALLDHLEFIVNNGGKNE